MDFKQIQELIKIVSKSELTELKVEQEGFKITLKKTGTPVMMQPGAARVVALEPQATMPASGAEITTTSESASTGGSGAKQENAKPSDNQYITIKSPMVGTFYRSPSPDKGPFVKVGDTIRKGTHICVIEAMKLFNEIESEFDGKVVKVLAEDASPVEYEQPLFLIEPV